MALAEIGSIAQIFSFLLNSFNTRQNNALRADTLKANQLKDEQQLKLYQQQQKDKRYDMWLNYHYQRDHKDKDHAIDMHKEKCKLSGISYPIYKWHEGVKSMAAPVVVVSTNIDQIKKNEKIIDSPPLDKLYKSISSYNKGNHITIETTKEYFSDTVDVKRFFNREIHCPSIIVYSNLSDSSLDIMICMAGITNEQKLAFEQTGQYEPHTFCLWEIEYTRLQNWQSKSINDKNISSKQWLTTLAEYIECIAGIFVQSLIDEYFQNEIDYTPQAINYLLDRKLKYFEFKEWGDFEIEINARQKIITETQKRLQKQKRFLENEVESFQLEFIPLKDSSIQKALLSNTNKTETIFQNEIYSNIHPFKLTFPLELKPSFSSGYLKIKGKNGKYGFINLNGELAIPFLYEDADIMQDGYVAVKKESKWGLVDITNTIVFPFQFDEVLSPDNGSVIVKENGGWRIADLDGIYLTSHNFKTLSEATAYSKTNKGLNDKKVPKKNISLLQENDLTKVQQNNLIGFKDDKNNLIIDFLFAESTDFEYGRAFVKLNSSHNQINQWCIINSQGHILVEKTFTADENEN